MNIGFLYETDFCGRAMQRQQPPPAAAPMAPPVIKLIRQGRLLAVHVHRPGPGPDFQVPGFGTGDAFMVSVPLVALDVEVWRNGRSLGRHLLAAGGVQLFDLRQFWRALVHPPYETVNLHIPNEVLAEAAGLDPAMLVFDPPPLSADRVDATMHGLATALVPAFRSPSEVSALFVDQVILAAATHLVDAYSGPAHDHRVLDRPNAGLAVWQQRRVADLLLGQLDQDIPLGLVAESCGLSLGYFSRAFRISFGLPPHRWVLRERVRRAAQLMSDTGQPIDQIAVACGFTDQSHLSRVFRRHMNMPPAAWRRTQRAVPGAYAMAELKLGGRSIPARR